MAIIGCPECSKAISDKAPACPHCGAPRASRTVTIQRTSKPIKGAGLLFWWLAFGCVIAYFNTDTQGIRILWMLLFVAALIGGACTRAAKWWNHG